MTTARSIHCPQHVRHVGTCPACQRARLEAEKRQLAEVDAIRARAAHERKAPGLGNRAPVEGVLR
jgi:hypothetical protein